MNNSKNQLGAINLAVWVPLATILLIVAFLSISYISSYNYGAAQDAALKATYKSNQNIFSNYQQKLQEAAQIPNMMTEDLVKITKAAIEGRYGDKGSQAVVQMIRETNPNLDSRVYIKLQQIIEAGRDEFKNGQNRLLDQKAAYETQINSFWRGTMLRMAGFPKVNLDEYKTITTESTQKSFATGTEGAPIKLR